MPSKPPLFQHRHFVAIAAILAKLPPDFPVQHEDVVQHFARELAPTNPQFSRERFTDAARGTPARKDTP